MKLKPIYLISLILAVVLLAVGALIAEDVPQDGTEPTVEATVPEVTDPTDPTEESTAPSMEPVEEITEPVTEAPTEPQEIVYTLSFVGDCTLGGTDASRDKANSFFQVVGDDYDYPLANVRHIFEADDFTLANLECALTDVGTAMEKQYAYRGYPAYAAILSGGSVEAVSNSNNHYYDFGYEGMDATRAALKAEGIARGWRGSFLYTTDSGLTIGVFCDDFSFEKPEMRAAFAELREKGAEVIVCAFHWGDDRAYKPNADQKTWGRIAIDEGADIVVGHHPHVLQPIEYYGGGVIVYSLGNFCYGGNTNPEDKDTAIVQQQFVRRDDGSVSLGETVIIPCSVSSVSERNNYQPTPLAEGSAAYERVLQKLAGTWE